MFRLASPDDTYPGSVEAMVPGADAPQRFPVRWRLLKDSEINALLAQGSATLLKRAVAGWEGVHEHDGTAIPFSDQNLALLLDKAPYVRRAMLDAYVRFAAGQPEKNSATPPADGGEAAKAPTSPYSPRTGMA